MATMNVSLPAEMLAFVEKEAAEGGYASSSEVVREALRLLRHEKALEREKISILRREIDRGIDQADQGLFSRRSPSDIADAVTKKYFG